MEQQKLNFEQIGKIQENRIGRNSQESIPRDTAGTARRAG